MDTDPRTDAQLLTAHVDGDRDAFGVLVRRHQDRAWAVALRTLGSPAEAEDAVQDAFLSALRGAATFRGDAQVSTWLHRIVVNACLDRLRRRATRPQTGIDSLEDLPSRVEVVEQPDTARSLDIRAALHALPEDQRVAVVLVDVEDIPVAEVAAALGVPEGTVKSRCHRGRARLAIALGHLRNQPGTTGVTSAGGEA